MEQIEKKINPAFLKAISQQLQKDFMMFNVNFSVEEILTLHLLKKLISENCDVLLQSNPKKLAQIIYRIDLPEKAVSGVLVTDESTDKSSLLADLMINRTEQKIQLRSLFNSHVDKIE